MTANCGAGAVGSVVGVGEPLVGTRWNLWGVVGVASVEVLVETSGLAVVEGRQAVTGGGVRDDPAGETVDKDAAVGVAVDGVALYQALKVGRGHEEGLESDPMPFTLSP